MCTTKTSLGPLLFVIYVKNITKNMGYIINLFADDTLVQQRILIAASFEIIIKDIKGLTAYGVQKIVIFCNEN